MIVDAFSTDGFVSKRTSRVGPYPNAPGSLSLEDMRMYADALDGLWTEDAGDTTAPEGSFSDQQAASEELYFQHFEIISPRGQHAVRTGSAPADADAAIDSLVPTDIQVRVRPARNRETHKDRADRLAKFARGIIAHVRKKRDIFRLVSSDQVIRHVGILRVTFDTRLWPTQPVGLDEDKREEWELRSRKFPVLVQVRNPRYVRWQQNDEGDLIAVAESYYTSVGEARVELSEYPIAIDLLRGRRPTEKIRIRDIWVVTDRCILIEDQPIFGYGDDGVLAHGYDEPPYIIIPFRELHFEEMGRRYRGMLSNAKGLYQIESQVLTAHVWMLFWNSWRTWKGHFAGGRKVEIIPGEVIDVDPQRGEYLELMSGEAVSPELMGTASMVDAYIQRNGVAQGPRAQEGTRSAQQVWAIQSIRQLKVEPAKQSLQQGVERMLTLIARILVARLPADTKLWLPVPGRDRDGEPIGEVSIAISDLATYEESFDVTFGRRLDPAVVEQAKSMMGFAMNGWMPRIKSWELSGLTESPEEWEDLIALQKVDDLDFITEITTYQRLLSYYGNDPNDWRVAMYQQRMQNPPPVRGRVAGGGGAAAANGQMRGPIQPTSLPTGPAPTAGGVAPQRGSPQLTGRIGPAAPRGVSSGGMPGETAAGIPGG